MPEAHIVEAIDLSDEDFISFLSLFREAVAMIDLRGPWRPPWSRRRSPEQADGRADELKQVPGDDGNGKY